MRRLVSTDASKREEVEQAAFWKFGEGEWTADYDHGKWWITVEDDDTSSGCRQYSVVDTSNGLDFEEL